MRKILILLCMALLLSALAADDLSVVQTVPATAHYGDPINVSIAITNNMPQRTDATLSEQITDATLIGQWPSADTGSTPWGEIGAHPPVYSWPISVDAHSTYVFNYSLMPDTLGDYNWGSAVVTLPDGRSFSSSYRPSITDVVCANSSLCNIQCDPHASQDCAFDVRPLAPRSSGINYGLIACLAVPVILVLMLGIAAFIILRRRPSSHPKGRKKP